MLAMGIRFFFRWTLPGCLPTRNQFCRMRITTEIFDEIYLINNTMKVSVDRERIKLYIKIGLAYLGIWLLTDLFSHPETFFKRTANNIWLVGYLVILNFIFFEYVLPFIKLTWKRILIGLFL